MKKRNLSLISGVLASSILFSSAGPIIALAEQQENTTMQQLDDKEKTLLDLSPNINEGIDSPFLDKKQPLKSQDSLEQQKLNNKGNINESENGNSASNNEQITVTFKGASKEVPGQDYQITLSSQDTEVKIAEEKLNNPFEKDHRYNFIGWENEETRELFNFNKPVDESATYIPRYTVNHQVTVLDSETKQELQRLSVKAGEKIEHLPDNDDGKVLVEYKDSEGIIYTINTIIGQKEDQTPDEIILTREILNKEEISNQQEPLNDQESLDDNQLVKETPENELTEEPKELEKSSQPSKETTLDKNNSQDKVNEGLTEEESREEIVIKDTSHVKVVSNDQSTNQETPSEDPVPPIMNAEQSLYKESPKEISDSSTLNQPPSSSTEKQQKNSDKKIPSDSEEVVDSPIADVAEEVMSDPEKRDPKVAIENKKIDKLKVTFVAEGKIYQEIPIDKNTMVQQPANPTSSKETALFAGWYTDPITQTEQTLYNFNQSVTSDITLYGRFSDDLQMSFKEWREDLNEYVVIDTFPLKRYQVLKPTVQQVTPPKVGNEAGKAFHHWYRQADPLKRPVNFSQEIAEQDEIFLPAFSNEKIVSYDTKGSHIESEAVELDKEGKGYLKSVPPAPERSGYRFIGWSLTSDGDILSEPLTNHMITEDVTFYARWEAQPVSYRIAYWGEKENIVGDPGKNRDNYQFKEFAKEEIVAPAGVDTTNELVQIAIQKNLPKTPELTAYFDYSHVEQKTISGTGDTIVNVFYKRKLFDWQFKNAAQLRNNILTFTSSGKEHKLKQGEIFTIKVKLGQNVADIYPTNTQYSKNNFYGWDMGNRKVQVSKLLAATPDLLRPDGLLFSSTYTRSSRPVEIQYYRETIGNTKPLEGVENKDWVKHNDKYYEVMPDYSQKLILDSKLTPKDIKGLKYVESILEWGTWSVLKSQKLLYNRLSNHTLTYDLMGGTTTSTSTQFSDLQFELPIKEKKIADPTREGYQFKGWFYDEYGKNPADFEQDLLKSDTTLFAKWEPDALNVNFYWDESDSDNERKPYATIGHSKEGELTYPDGLTPGLAVENRGEFKGWYYRDKQGALREAPETLRVFKELSVFAVWNKTNFSISYQKGAASSDINLPKDPEKYNLGLTVKVKNWEKAPAPKGKVFVGWKSNYPNDIGRIYYPGSSIKILANTVLTAHFVDVNNQATVTYHSNTPAIEKRTFIVEKGTQHSLQDNKLFQRDNYKLIGWSTSSSEKDLIKESSLLITRDTTLYAIWKEEEVTVTFNANGGKFKDSLTQKKVQHHKGMLWKDNPNLKDYSSDLVAPKGKVFSGWTPKLPTYDTIINQDSVYTAQWKDALTWQVTGKNYYRTVIGRGQRSLSAENTDEQIKVSVSSEGAKWTLKVKADPFVTESNQQDIISENQLNILVDQQPLINKEQSEVVVGQGEQSKIITDLKLQVNANNARWAKVNEKYKTNLTWTLENKEIAKAVRSSQIGLPEKVGDVR